MPWTSSRLSVNGPNLLRTHGGELPPDVFLQVPRHQLVALLVLWVDACLLF